ncbi:hypothetical protein GCM10010222_00420 [Streptomyces tanashiensis]|uniref:hypothetical protein n=1 Tax=Streptomyces tanashiensis TaxID=67367 RepID=UPI00167C1796|nr:hypothetical protein [Streptomyces tanashiensis]GGS64178.1 hypothetical protein GCM10010222_00420 [Streptomyces tanashiensis]
MFAYELHTMHHAELIAEAAAHRLAHEAAATHKGLHLFGRRHAGQVKEGQVTDGGRGRFVRAA